MANRARKWVIPSYARKSALPANESQMKHVFEDAELTNVALGRANPLHWLPVYVVSNGVCAAPIRYCHCRCVAWHGFGSMGDHKCCEWSVRECHIYVIYIKRIDRYRSVYIVIYVLQWSSWVSNMNTWIISSSVILIFSVNLNGKE